MFAYYFGTLFTRRKAFDQFDQGRGFGSGLGRVRRDRRTTTEQGRAEEAISLYRKILAQDSENSVARNNLGCLLLGIENIEEALEVLEENPDPKPPRELRHNLGYALLQRGDLHRAERVFRGVLSDDEDDSEARNHLGMVLLRRKRVDEAISELFAELGLAQVIEAVRNAPCHPPSEPVPVTQDAPGHASQHRLLRAHEILSELSDENRERFATVVKLLRAELGDNV